MTIWSKGTDATAALVHAFTVGDDLTYDRQLTRHDLLGSLAHARMLLAVGLLEPADAQRLIAGLSQLYQEATAGRWQVPDDEEDVHSAVEAELTRRLGDAGKRLHTGRSRNDQVLTDLRLWQREHLAALALEAIACAQALLAQARAHEFHPFPGYTHQQRAMPASLGMFFGAHAQALCDSLPLAEAAWELTDACPLGSGASVGVGLPLDRAMTARLLGFGRAPGIALADANARGKVETAVVDAASALLQDLGRFSADMLFATTSECGFFTLGAGFTTGSSIMPQKKNLDLFELVRARGMRVLGMRTALCATTHGLISGYARDLQDTKALCLEAVHLVRAAVAVVTQAVPTIHPVRERILSALTPDIYATDEAYRLVRERGMPFRDAYREVGTHLERLRALDHDAVVRGRTHEGSTGRLGLEALGARLAQATARWQARRDHLAQAWQALLGLA